MNEIVEMIYQWHQGGSIKGIERSLGFDRKTIRKYVKWAKDVGVQRGESFPEEAELISRIRALTDSSLLRETPVRDLINPHHDWIEGVIQDPMVTAKQVWRLFREEKGIGVSYYTMKRYLTRIPLNRP